MRCDDGHFYVVKFQNNPQHLRVLANELLATRLAKLIGLPVPEPAIVRVDEWIVANTAELSVQLAGHSERYQAGLHFGARYAIDPMEGMIFDYLPETLLDRVRNLQTFAGMLAFDKWACNADSRQAVFWRKSRERKYSAAFVDHGYCFNAGEWKFPDSPLRGVYAWNEVYTTRPQPFTSNERVWLCPAPPVPDMSASWSDGNRVCLECTSAASWSAETVLV